MNSQSLYPVVVDLTDAEYTPQGFCCSQYICSGGVEFSFQDLLSREDMPIPQDISQYVQQSERTTRQELSGRRSPSQGSSPNSAPQKQIIIEIQKDHRDDVAHNQVTSFDDCYVLTRQVHKGLISVIWECVHKKTGLRYAVKVVDRRRITTQAERAVYREAHMLDIIDPGTPGTIYLHHFFDEPTHFYIITEYAPGGNLLARVIRKKKLSEDDTKPILRSILQCLIYHHDNGTVHRNLKPDNILLDGKYALIADYGLAAQLMYDDAGEMQLFTARCGTSAYVSPEILNKQPYATQVDMWGVGIIAYMCLLGYPPFSDESKQVLFARISKADYTIDQQDWSSISRLAKRFISSLLHVDPVVRMTAREALDHPWLASPIPDPPKSERAVAITPDSTFLVGTKSIKNSPTMTFRRVLSSLLVSKKKDDEADKTFDDGSTSSCNTSILSSSDIAGRKMLRGYEREN